MKYIARFRVDDFALELIMGVMKKGAIEGIEFLDLLPENTDDPPTFRPHRYLGGMRKKGIKGTDLVIKTIEANGGAATIAQLRKAFSKEGFAEKSSEPAASQLAREGKLTRDTDGRYRLVK